MDTCIEKKGCSLCKNKSKPLELNKGEYLEIKNQQKQMETRFLEKKEIIEYTYTQKYTVVLREAILKNFDQDMQNGIIFTYN